MIIDSYSADATVDLAKALGADVYEHPFENHATQFSWALDNIDLQTEWVMKVDADEEFTPELANEIEQKLDALPSNMNGVILRRRVYFMGKWIKHGGKYPELLLRIFRVGHGMSEMKLMDEHLIITDGDVTIFKNDFSDNNKKSLEWWINKHNWYSNKEVLDQQMKSDAVNREESVEETSTSLQAKVKRFVKNHGKEDPFVKRTVNFPVNIFPYSLYECFSAFFVSCIFTGNLFVNFVVGKMGGFF